MKVIEMRGGIALGLGCRLGRGNATTPGDDGYLGLNLHGEPARLLFSRHVFQPPVGRRGTGYGTPSPESEDIG